MISRYRISLDDFGALAAGYGGSSALSILRSSQLSRHLLLLRMIFRDQPEGTKPSLDVLVEAQDRSPSAVAELLSEPWVGAWASRYLLGGESLGYLAAVAAVAAARTGVDADLTGEVRDGRVMLPTMGAAILPLPDRTPAQMRVCASQIAVEAIGHKVEAPLEPRRDSADWLGRRVVSTECDGERMVISVDDLDPYRDCYRMRIGGRVSWADFGRWQNLLRDAWILLVRQMPARAAEIADGLRAIVPLADTEGGPGLSGTSRHAFGAFCLTPPADGAALAITFVHEFQHAKLNALLDLLPLHHRSNGTLYYAPWRADPRPIRGLLHGCYAFAGVADAWSRLRVVPELADLAQSEFARVREQVRQANAILAESKELTSTGHRFVTGMQSAVAKMMAHRCRP